MALAAALFAALGLGLTGCGSSTKANSGPVTSTTLEVAGPNPSVSAKMVCGEAKDDIASQVGVDTSQPLKPKWVVATHLYSCVYHYGAGEQMTLSIKEMSSPAETTAYFDGLAHTMHREADVGIGQGGFVTPDGSIVVRKDYRVLTVDVSHLPAQFGKPPKLRSAFATSVASAIMQCWTGE